jgi:hypothetical protein
MQPVELRALQRRFAEYVVSGDPCVHRDVESTPEASAEARLAVYHGAYRARLVEALSTEYPAVRAALGPGGFAAMAAGYVDTHPSTDPNLRWFGDRLADYLAATLPYRARGDLAELAAFEWALSVAFDADDATPVDLTAIGAIPYDAWDGMGFEWHASVRSLPLAYDVPAFWKAVEGGVEPLPTVTRGAVPVRWLVWRQALANFYRPLADDEARAYDVASAQGTFGDLCAALCECLPEDEVALRAAGLLKRWVADGLIVAVSAGQ